MNNKLKTLIVLLFVITAGVIIIGKNRETESVLNTKTAETAAAEQQLPKLLDLGSHSCIPCKMMMPILDTLRDVYDGKMDVQFIDVWQDREASNTYGVRAIPTQIIYDSSGKELFRHEGFWSREDIENKLVELGVFIGDNS